MVTRDSFANGESGKWGEGGTQPPKLKVKFMPTIIKKNMLPSKSKKWLKGKYLIGRSVSSLNNPQNSEMKICENMKLKC
jgi:hypothetical protein